MYKYYIYSKYNSIYIASLTDKFSLLFRPKKSAFTKVTNKSSLSPYC